MSAMIPPATTLAPSGPPPGTRPLDDRLKRGAPPPSPASAGGSGAAGPRRQAGWLVTTWAAAVVGVGALALAGAWSSWLPPLVLVLAAVVPMALLRTAIGLGVSRWAASSVLVLLLLLTAYLLSSGADTAFLDLLTDSVPRLLTEPRPYPVRADLLVAPLLLSGLLSVLTGLRLDARTRVAPVAAAGILYAAGALLTTGRSDRWGVLAVLIVVLAVLGWVLLDEHTEPVRRRFVVALPPVVVLVGALACVALVPPSDPFEPRDLVDPPTLDVQTTSPLPRLGAWAANPDLPLFSVRGERVPLRLVALDTFDGTQWRAATSYAPLGSPSGDPGLPPGERRRTVSLDIELDGLGGTWLPTPGDPVALDRPGAVVDAGTGTVFDPAIADDTAYSVTGVVDAPEPEDLLGATVPTGERAAPYLSLPPMQPALAAYVAGVVPDGSPYQVASAIEAAVQHDRRLSKRSISGSAYWRVQQFLLGDVGDPGARVGTSEQFAAAFAVIARQHGLPTRLVVGFQPGEEQPDGSWVVRGADALAWPEVYFDRLGWVPFSPTPRADPFDADRPETSLPEPRDPVRDPAEPAPSASPGPPTAEGDGPGRPESAAAPASGPAGPSPWWWALAVLLVPIALLALRGGRRVAHARQGPAGAWREVVDALVLSGHPPARARTATDVAADADQRWGTRSARAVAESAERAAFAPDPAALPETERRRLRGDVRRVRRAAWRTVPWWRRWWWPLDPRVLTRR